MMQTQEAILAEIERVAQTVDDFFGAQRQELAHALTFENAIPFLVDGATSEMWDEAKPYRTDEEVRAAAVEYLDFAIGKALNHRGLSASRSISHFLGWAFLLGGEEARQQIEDAGYANYGAPQLEKAAEVIGIRETWAKYLEGDDGVQLKRMAASEPCVPECDEGCGR